MGKQKTPLLDGVDVVIFCIIRTIDPDHHTGDDIYVLTRLFEQVKIIENGFNLIHDNFNDSWIINL